MKKPKNRDFEKKLGKKIFKAAKKPFRLIYWLAGNLTVLKSNKKLGYISKIDDINKLNKIMKYYYKRDELVLYDDNKIEDISFLTSDNVKIKGIKFITNKNSKKWIISSHWFAGEKYLGLIHTKAFIELGYNILSFDFRNHGDSEQTEVISMGLFESRDLISAINYLINNNEVETLGLFGMSMGAYICNYVAINHKELLDKANVKFIISDSTYGSIESLLYKNWKERLHILINKRLARKIINKTIDLQTLATNHDQKELNLFDMYENQKMIPANAPILFIHGCNDQITPHTDSLRLFINRSIYNSDDELLIYNSCNHCFSFKEHYYQTIYRILMFENKIIKDNNATKLALDKMGISDEIINNNFNEIKEVSTFYFSKNKNNEF
ncbi:alpha/beta hydrolase [Mycoplasma capricolum]|uniref:Alpha/beta hydrolase family protein n=1 Tax=Mycoplasma capricolum subsp. capricolum TaxID=40479 RepID=A0A0C2ZLX9_MYCCA|nr:alpha/beta fold hydrolase [Mycoplasma capricolum]KIM13940.1 alpha/beta hydrolase family protein [Mycoplasma capricolum subsp. capricolum]